MLPKSIKKYGFIAKGPGLEPNQHSSHFQSESFRMFAIGVDSVKAAEEVAKRLVADGVELIDLCSSFDARAAQRIAKAIRHVIPVCRATEVK